MTAQGARAAKRQRPLARSARPRPPAVANAPRNVARKVQSMAELDHNINFAEAAAAAVRSGAYGKTVDLSLLTAQLIPQSKVRAA